MPHDLMIKNGMVVDGSGFSRYRADVAVQDGRIAEIGRIRGSAETTIDAEGLFVAPGIIDLHTHYDVQPFWDRLCTSSIWHGVTTVLTGNCGLTLAPLRPEHRETMLATFCCVEDLPVRSLNAVLPWTWQSFDEFLKAIDIGLGVNMMPLVGHNPLRLSVMDQEAWDRAATPDEIAAMQDLLRGALEEGAWGWSTTVSPTHAGPQGQPVPTRLAANDERLALGRTLGEFNRGIIEILPPGAGQPDEADRQHLFEVAQASGRPVFFLGFDASARDYVEGATRQGAQLYNLLRAIPFNPRFKLKKTTYFANLDVWDVVMAAPFDERMALLTNPEKRAELREAAPQRQRRAARRARPLHQVEGDHRQQDRPREEPRPGGAHDHRPRRGHGQARGRRDAGPRRRGEARDRVLPPVALARGRRGAGGVREDRPRHPVPDRRRRAPQHQLLHRR